MSSWSRDGLYNSPAVKSLLILTGASSLLHYTLSLRNQYPSVLICLRVWALPSPGTWLLSAMLCYYCRVLERRVGTWTLFNYVLISATVGVGATGVLVAISNIGWTQFTGMHGALVHIVVGSLLVKYMSKVTSSYSSQLAGFRLPGTLPFYALSAMFCCSSMQSMLLTFCGMVGGLLADFTGFSLPCPPTWVGSAVCRLIGSDTPPILYSGASLQVQREQQMDDVERMINQMYQQRGARPQVRIGDPVQVQPAPPPDDKVEQLVRMGFSQEDSVRALLHTGSDIQASVQLLTASSHQ